MTGSVSCFGTYETIDSKTLYKSIKKKLQSSKLQFNLQEDTIILISLCNP